MASTNLFELLGDDDIGDINLFLEKKKEASSTITNAVGGPKKATTDAATAKPAKLPTKPAPPSQAVREARNEGGRGDRGRGGRGGRGYGRERGPDGANRDFPSNNGAFTNENGISAGFKEDRERSFDRRGGFGGPRGGSRGGRRGGFNNGDAAEGERPRRMYERHSGSGRSNDFKRDGAGRGNWGTPTDEIAPGTEEPAAENETNVAVEKIAGEEENAADVEKEIPVTESEVKEPEPEEKQMTLEEYEKVLEEKRKALVSLKSEERKVDVDKEFESMQLVSKKKNDDEVVFIKLGSDKDKRKDAFEKEERAKKSVSINEFLKPGEGEKYYRGGRGKGRGGRGRGEAHDDGGRYGPNNVPAPSIEDATQFPSLGAK